MRCQVARFRKLIFAAVACLAWDAVPHSVNGQRPPSHIQQYCNQQYAYCVNLPNSGRAVPHEGDAPNHGVTVELPGSGGYLWTYAHWDAALLGGSNETMTHRRAELLKEHHGAAIAVESTTLGDLSAYRFRLSYADVAPMTEELIVAYANPKGGSNGPGVIYEIGLKCKSDTYPVNGRILDALTASFRRTTE